MVVGLDLKLEQIPSFLGKTFMRCFSGKLVCLASLRGCLEENWAHGQRMVMPCIEECGEHVEYAQQ